ncbi:MAG: bifunctional oligoribonuclease/PAP phosphatase NrnA [Lachnospiraceae bacterium]|nr:bifunctional oligoribonuclease/PAP phosphatase NrnA [Lachnospiraceae bacterium]MBQ8667840.1 bifunctional oligoribonuclease/PAP phosphatase NrnA [Lachnospiraceae bacterium]MBR1450815.1 bifunctional oligoribonuclease/PAP phosphatase NrnA [Lachnospiraceae bacterium]
MNLLEEIGNAKSVAIAGHIRPDGDCISSTLALRGYLKNARPGAKITVFTQDNPPTIFSYLEGYDEMNLTYSPKEKYDVFVALDVSSLDRLGDSLWFFENAGKTICVDHHETNPGLADVNEIRPKASSTCEVLFDLFEKEYMDDKVAECLFTGIVHDSGVFQYSNMSRKSFNTVGELVEYDFDGPKIIQDTFYEKSYIQNQILGRALLESILFMDGKCIVSMVDRKMMDFYNVLPKHLEGIVNQLKNTRGVEVAIFMYEMGTQRFKVSMRSNGLVNVAKVAAVFGGGGHERAAGVEMNGTYYDVINALSREIEKQMK